MSDTWTVNISGGTTTTVVVTPDTDTVDLSITPPFANAIVFSETEPLNPNAGDIWLYPA